MEEATAAGSLLSARLPDTPGPGMVGLFNSRDATLWAWMRVFLHPHSPPTNMAVSVSLDMRTPAQLFGGFLRTFFASLLEKCTHAHTRRRTACDDQVKLRSSHKTTIPSNSKIRNTYICTSVHIYIDTWKITVKFK